MSLLSRSEDLFFGDVFSILHARAFIKFWYRVMTDNRARCRSFTRSYSSYPPLELPSVCTIMLGCVREGVDATFSTVNRRFDLGFVQVSQRHAVNNTSYVTYTHRW